MDGIIKVENLSVSFREIPALWDVSFNIPRGELVAIVGSNGAGKSTLLKTILGMIKPNTGSVSILGKPHDKLKEKHKHVVYMPQRESVDWTFPATVLDVVLMGRYGHIGLFRRPGRKDRKLAMEALGKFGMEDYHDRQIGELSGGQKQRVFLSRAYVQNADIFFLDEPFGGVDSKTETMTLNLLKELRDEGKTILVVTHDLSTLAKYFDRVLLLKRQVIAYGIPDEVLTEENLIKAYGGLLHMHVH